MSILPFHEAKNRRERVILILSVGVYVLLFIKNCMSPLIFNHHKIVIEGETFISKVWNPAGAQRTIAIVPPGGVNIDWNIALSNDAHNISMHEFIETSNIVIFDYPGIGKAPAAKHAKLEELAVRFITTLEDLGFQKVVLIGISFGGCVANEMIDKKPELFTKIVIAASGEFLFFPIKQIFISMVFINIYLPFTSSLIKFLLVDVVKFFEPFDLNDVHSLVIMGRSVFKYKIGKQQHNTPAQLIFLKNDCVVRPDSIPKMLAKYPNNTVINLDIHHRKSLDKNEKEKVEKIVFEKVFPFLKNSI